jgi:hypothetical protein
VPKGTSECHKVFFFFFLQGKGTRSKGKGSKLGNHTLRTEEEENKENQRKDRKQETKLRRKETKEPQQRN